MLLEWQHACFEGHASNLLLGYGCSGATPKDYRILPDKIFLVRHAESEGNVDNIAYTYIPDSQVPLVSRYSHVMPCMLRDMGHVSCKHASTLRDMGHVSCKHGGLFFFFANRHLFEDSRLPMMVQARGMPDAYWLGVGQSHGLIIVPP